MTDASATTPSRLARSLSAHPFESKLSEQLSQTKAIGDFTLFPSPTVEKGDHLAPPVRSSSKSRSLSDAAKPSSSKPPSAPGDVSRLGSKDDSTIPSAPATPQRTSLHQHSLSLNLPSKNSTASSAISRAPLSPKLDSSQIYGSPASMLPRRSRGLDFSRACTHLHHSTLAESSPDSSPTIGGRGVNIPNRRRSPGSTSVPPFSTSGPTDRATISSSVSSINMMESDTSSSDEDDEPMIADRDDVMMITNTPQAAKMGGGMNPFAVGNVPSPGNDWMGNYSQAASSLLSFQRARFRKSGRSRHSSSSASGNSSKPSPGPLSPGVLKSIESTNGGYFNAKSVVQSRRESLSLGTHDLRLSDVSDEGEARNVRRSSPTGALNVEGGPLGVIRRAVTRRGSLLPKTKTFARIRAALMEESAPIDSEAKREAEVIRQVRESEPSVPEQSPTLTAFPADHPTEPCPEALDDESQAKIEATSSSESSFSQQVMRNSGGQQFWNTFDGRYRTPPPSLGQRGPSSVSEEDMAMDMTPSTVFGTGVHDFVKPWERPRSRSSTPHISTTMPGPEIHRKRRRDDDFDPNLFKRRAVSPSLSVQSSPILAHSPTVKDTGPNIWGPPAKPVLGPPFTERTGSETGSRNGAQAGPLKRVGLQGMNEASDGFMNMSIE